MLRDKRMDNRIAHSLAKHVLTIKGVWIEEISFLFLYLLYLTLLGHNFLSFWIKKELKPKKRDN
jgi:hypothetical protein